MTTYTVRNADNLDPLYSKENLDDALVALDVERGAYLLNPPDNMSTLELVITADDADADPGDIVVRFAASPSTNRGTPAAFFD